MPAESDKTNPYYPTPEEVAEEEKALRTLSEEGQDPVRFAAERLAELHRVIAGIALALERIVREWGQVADPKALVRQMAEALVGKNRPVAGEEDTGPETHH